MYIYTCMSLTPLTQAALTLSPPTPVCFARTVLLFMMMFALLGKELMGGRGLPEVTRYHYDKPITALLTVMTIFTGEWAGIVYEAVAAHVRTRTSVEAPYQRTYLSSLILLDNADTCQTSHGSLTLHHAPRVGTREIESRSIRRCRSLTMLDICRRRSCCPSQRSSSLSLLRC